MSLGRKAIATVIFLLPVLPGQNVSFGQKHMGQNRAFVYNLVEHVLHPPPKIF